MTGVQGVVVSDPSAGRRETAIKLGVSNAIDPQTSDLRQQIADLSGGEGIDVVVDTFGSGTTRHQAIDIVAPGGRVVLLGLHDDHFEESGASLVLLEISISGSFGYSRKSFASSAATVGQGLLDSFFSECLVRPLAEGPEAFRELAAGALAAPRAILTP
jgi:threonine dehydrogenase-like Zn-dependent dehydrogenase